VADVCEPATETCDGIDEDCDGVIDNGACTACACARWAGAYAPLELAGPDSNVHRSYRGRLLEVAFDGEGVVAFLHSSTESLVSTEIFLAFHDVDGSAIVAPRSLALVPDLHLPGDIYAATRDGISGPVAYGGGRFVASWATGLRADVPGDGEIHAAAFGLDGSMLVNPLVLDLGEPDAGMVGLAMVGDTSYFVFTHSREMFVQRFDASLTSVGAPVAIPEMRDSVLGLDVRTVGDTVVITGPITNAMEGTTVRTVLIRDGALVGFSDLAQISDSDNTGVRAAVASDGTDDALVCFRDIGDTLSCRHISLGDASSTSHSFRVIAGSTSLGIDMVFAGCGYQVIHGESAGGGSSVFRTFEIDANDTILKGTVDRLWVQSNHSFAAFQTNAGGMLRVLEDKQVAIHFCAPALPEPDCAQLRADITDQACGGCGGDPSYCYYRNTGNHKGVGAPIEDFSPIACADIDTIACRIAMDQPQLCDGEVWLIPPDCILPK